MPIVPRPIPAPARTPPEMYRELGLMCGLEVHQQLLTKKKLFCRCPAGPYREDYDAEILRHMRPTLSEMGEYDGTALMEKKTKKEIIYQITGDTTCTYEMDDSPPFMINDEAVDVALDLSLLLGTGIVGELQIARKQYLDGSIPTGFQRTAIIGLTGSIPFRGRRIGIRQISIEEDSCREISDRGHRRVYRTDRLSRPLTETVTEPDMTTPEEAAAVCKLIARIARSTGRVRTGIGAGRQDVNVSVRGGVRVEIKGVPRIPLIPALVHYEGFRQRALLDVAERLAEAGRTAADFAPAEHAVDEAARRLPLPAIAAALTGGGVARLVVLPGFREILPWPVGPTRKFVDELSDLVRVVACLDRLPNLLTEGDGILPPAAAEEFRRISGAGPEDGIVLTWGPAADVRTAVEEIRARCQMAYSGVPAETRQVLPTGETRFERVLPGPDRMYPDTDLPPLSITDERIEASRARLPLPVWEAEERLRELGVPAHEAEALAASPDSRIFFRVVGEAGVPPCDAARVLVSERRALARRGVPVAAIGDEALTDLLVRYGRGEFAREAFPDLLRALAGGRSPAEAIAERIGRLAAEADAARRVEEVLAAAPAIEKPDARRRNLMGLAMPGLRGRIPGAAVGAVVDRAIGGGAR